MLYDTLLRDFTPEEVDLVVAHELGHVRYRDVPRGLLFLLVVAPVGVLAAQRLIEAWVPDPERRGTAAMVPAAALAARRRLGRRRHGGQPALAARSSAAPTPTRSR